MIHDAVLTSVPWFLAEIEVGVYPLRRMQPVANNHKILTHTHRQNITIRPQSTKLALWSAQIHRSIISVFQPIPWMFFKKALFSVKMEYNVKDTL